ISTPSEPNAQLFDGGGVVQSTLLQIPGPFRTAVQLQLVESECLLQQRLRRIRASVLAVSEQCIGGMAGLEKARRNGSDLRRAHIRDSRTDSCGHLRRRKGGFPDVMDTTQQTLAEYRQGGRSSCAAASIPAAEDAEIGRASCRERG